MATAAAAPRRNEAIVAALSKRLSTLSLDLEKLSPAYLEGRDLLALLVDVLCLTPTDELTKWVRFAEALPSQPEGRHGALKLLDEALAPRSVLVGDGVRLSEADVVVFSALHAVVSGLSTEDRNRYRNVLRWMDFVQNREEFGGALDKIVIEKAEFHVHDVLSSNKVEVNQLTKDDSGIMQKLVNKMKDAAVSDLKESTEVKDAVANKTSEAKKKNPDKPSVDTKPPEEKKKKGVVEASTKEAEVSISALNVQVGVILKAWKHPSADSLLVEEIDLGEGNLRQVVSGLAKYCSPEELVNRSVVLITNVKPGKLRDVMSSGLVLCASNEDHTIVEPLLPPKGAVPGERISFSGYEGKPEDVLNPKKKQLEKITPDLYTNDKGIATYKGVPFMTSAGPCTSSIRNAGIK